MSVNSLAERAEDRRVLVPAGVFRHRQRLAPCRSGLERDARDHEHGYRKLTRLDVAGPLTQLVKRTLSVTNSSNQHAVAYKVKTTAPKQYCVRPNSGRIEPGETVEVHVLLQPMKEDPAPGQKCRDKFLVQSVAITPERESVPLADLWKQLEDDDKARSEDGPAKIHEQKIRCAYLPAAESDVAHSAIPEEQVSLAFPLSLSLFRSSLPIEAPRKLIRHPVTADGARRRRFPHDERRRLVRLDERHFPLGRFAHRRLFVNVDATAGRHVGLDVQPRCRRKADDRSSGSHLARVRDAQPRARRRRRRACRCVIKSARFRRCRFFFFFRLAQCRPGDRDVLSLDPDLGRCRCSRHVLVY